MGEYPSVFRGFTTHTRTINKIQAQMQPKATSLSASSLNT